MRQPVLNYHAIGQPDSPDFAEWVIEQEAFGEQLDMLATRGLTGVTMAQALQDPRPDQIAITFDDGYEDFVTHALPELTARSFNATLFVATSHVGTTARWLEGVGAGDRPMASWDQLRHALDHGIEIGSHSHGHDQLDLLSKTALAKDIASSRSVLSSELDTDVEGFCYPHGFHSEAVQSAVSSAGFRYACGVKHKVGRVDQNPFSIARIVVRRGDSTDQVSRWIDGLDLRPGGPTVERTLATGFRLYRRARRALTDR